jgi:hypothetical protein
VVKSSCWKKKNGKTNFYSAGTETGAGSGRIEKAEMYPDKNLLTVRLLLRIWIFYFLKNLIWKPLLKFDALHPQHRVVYY